MERTVAHDGLVRAVCLEPLDRRYLIYLLWPNEPVSIILILNGVGSINPIATNLSEVAAAHERSHPMSAHISITCLKWSFDVAFKSV